MPTDFLNQAKRAPAAECVDDRDAKSATGLSGSGQKTESHFVIISQNRFDGQRPKLGFENQPAGGRFSDHQRWNAAQFVRRCRESLATPKSKPGGEMERTAFTRDTLQRQIAAHQLDQAARDREPQAGSTIPPRSGAIRLRERIEDQSLFFFGNSNTAIAHGEAQANLTLSLGNARYVDENLLAP